MSVVDYSSNPPVVSFTESEYKEHLPSFIRTEKGHAIEDLQKTLKYLMQVLMINYSLPNKVYYPKRELTPQESDKLYPAAAILAGLQGNCFGPETIDQYIPDAFAILNCNSALREALGSDHVYQENKVDIEKYREARKATIGLIL